MMNPITAVTHPNPYPYYAELIGQKPIYFDETLNMWVASSAQAVTAVLTSPLCRVRPVSEPIPKMLIGSPAAEIFRYLVRMNDGENHHALKQAVAATLMNIPLVAQESEKWASCLAEEMTPNFAFHLPIYVIGNLLGVPQHELQQVALWIDDFVRCLAPSSTHEQIEQGNIAAAHLLDLFHGLLAKQQHSLLSTLAEHIEVKDVVVANAIGFLTQAYEATAGLIGNTLLALAAHPEISEQARADSNLLTAAINETLRYDAPIQNTRRFLAQSGTVAGQPMKEGEMVLVILAAANHDSTVNPNPQQFDMGRENRRTFTFGAGVHACPGQVLAVNIAKAGVAKLIEVGFVPAKVTYRPSANARISLFMS